MKVMNVRVMIGQTGFGWLNIYFCLNLLFYYSSPVWSIILTFITPVAFDIHVWSWNFTHNHIKVVCLKILHCYVLPLLKHC